MNKQLQEEIVYNFLSSCFGVDIKESFENISEDDIKGAIEYINLLTYALNEQVSMKDVVQQHTRREAGRVKKGNEVIQHFLQNPDQYATPDTSPSRTTPPHQDFIRGTYKSLEQDGLVPYQGPGGEVQVTNNTGFKSDSVSATLNRIATGAKTRFKAPEKETPKTSTSSSGAYDITEPPLMAPEGSDAIPGELNQRLVTHALNAAAGIDTRNFTPGSPVIDYERITATKAREAQDAEFEKNLPNLAKLGADYEEAKAATDRAEVAAGRGTVEGERRIDQILSKPGGNKKAEAARQRAIASRARMADQDRASGMDTALGDPETFKFYQDRGITPTGKTDSGEPAFTLDDRTKYQVQQRMKELSGGRSATKSGSNLYVEQYTGSSSGPTGRVNVVDVRAERETGRRMANAGYPGSSVGPPRRPASQQESIPWNQDLMDQIVARSNTPEAIADRERRTERLDAASRARDEYAASERGQAEINSRVEAENASREQRGLPPLNASAERSFRRSAAASGGRRDQYTAARDERMGLPPVGTPQPQPETTTGQPEPVTGQSTTATPVIPGDPYEQGGPAVSTPEDRPQGTTSVASVLNSRGSVITPTTYRRPGSAGFGVRNTSVGNNIGFA